MRENIVYWIPIRTIAATEKDKWLECSNCGNKVNIYDLEQIRISNLNNQEQYKEAIKTQYRTCCKCGSKMNTEITSELRRMNIAKGSYGLQETVKKIMEYRNKLSNIKKWRNIEEYGEANRKNNR